MTTSGLHYLPLRYSLPPRPRSSTVLLNVYHTSCPAMDLAAPMKSSTKHIRHSPGTWTRKYTKSPESSFIDRQTKMQKPQRTLGSAHRISTPCERFKRRISHTYTKSHVCAMHCYPRLEAAWRWERDVLFWEVRLVASDVMLRTEADMDL